MYAKTRLRAAIRTVLQRLMHAPHITARLALDNRLQYERLLCKALAQQTISQLEANLMGLAYESAETCDRRLRVLDAGLCDEDRLLVDVIDATTEPMQLAFWRLIAWTATREEKERSRASRRASQSGVVRVCRTLRQTLEVLPPIPYLSREAFEADDEDIAAAANALGATLSDEATEPYAEDPLASAPADFQTAVVALQVNELSVSLLLERGQRADPPTTAAASSSSAAAEPRVVLCTRVKALHVRARQSKPLLRVHGTIGSVIIEHGNGDGPAARSVLLQLDGSDGTHPADDVLGGPIPSATADARSGGGLLSFFAPAPAEPTGAPAPADAPAPAFQPALMASVLMPMRVPPTRDKPISRAAKTTLAGAAVSAASTAASTAASSARASLTDVAVQLKGGDVTLAPHELWEACKPARIKLSKDQTLGPRPYHMKQT